MESSFFLPFFYYFLLLCSYLLPRIACMEEEHAIYLVLLEGKPVAFHFDIYQSDLARKYAKGLVESHDKLLQSKLEEGTYKKLYSFYHIINGFAIHTPPSQAKIIEKCPNVLLVEKDRGVKLMTTYTPHLLNLPKGVWRCEDREELTGDGMVIGVVDTGINPEHPSFAYHHFGVNGMNGSYDPLFFGACEVGPNFPSYSCNGKIVSARYFSTGIAAALSLNASHFSPFDEVGHGSHVASIAAGNAGVQVVVEGFNYGTASGMAPRARLAIYKAIYPEGGTLADVVSAIDQAIQDKVDVLVLSVGPNEPPEGSVSFMTMFEISLLFARKAGVFVVQAAGNKGPAAASVVSYSPWAVGVGAATTERSYNSTLITGDGHKIIGVGLSAPTVGGRLLQHKLAAAKDAAAKSLSPALQVHAEECQHPDLLQPSATLGSIVICLFSEGFYNGTSNLTAIIDTAMILGWMGFILVANPIYGNFVADPIPFSVRGILVPQVSDAQTLWQYYENNTCRDDKGVVIDYGATAAIGEGRVAELNNRALAVARYSSRGPDIVDINLTAADVLKPDIVAPGYQIWGAWSPVSALDPILSGNSFALVSGTSMAAPHAAGLATLVKQAHPSWTPAMIASAISTTASKHDNEGHQIMSQGADLYSLYPATPFDYGAGLINPSAALDPGLVFPSEFEDYIMFLCSIPSIDLATVRSTMGTQCNGSFPHPTDLNLPSITVSALRGFRKVRRHVINVSDKPETYTCSTKKPQGVKVRVRPCQFALLPQARQDFVISLNATGALQDFSFGEIVFIGDLDHIVKLPLAIWPIGL